MVDNVSIRSGTAGVADGTTHKQATDGVEEWQTASRCLLSHDGDDLLNAFWSLALVWPPCVHLGGFRTALARRRRLDAESLEEAREFGAGTVRQRRRERSREPGPRMPWVRRVVNVNCPLVPVLRDDARHDFFKRVPSRCAGSK